MARPWRIQFPGAAYHVTARGNDRRDIFLGDDDRRDMLDLLEVSCERFGLDVFAFCLMSNHYHLFLRTPEPNLSAVMHWINCAYTTRFNRRHQRCGHLLQGRYKSVVVGDDSHWLHLTVYIHLNPVRAGMVEDPAKYGWSSFRDYTRVRPRFAWLKAESVLALYGPKTKDAARRRRYRAHCLRAAGRPPPFWEETRNAVFLGAREQWERLKKEHPPSGREDTAVEFNLRPGRAVDFDEELKRVAKAFGVKADEIMAGRRKSYVRPSLYYHLVVHCGLTGARAAELIGVSEMAVSSGVKRVRDIMSSDRELRGRIDELKP
jgi:REP element-mobilizing transposase RayT